MTTNLETIEHDTAVWSATAGDPPTEWSATSVKLGCGLMTTTWSERRNLPVWASLMSGMRDVALKCNGNHIGHGVAVPLFSVDNEIVGWHHESWLNGEPGGRDTRRRIGRGDLAMLPTGLDDVHSRCYLLLVEGLSDFAAATAIAAQDLVGGRICPIGLMGAGTGPAALRYCAQRFGELTDRRVLIMLDDDDAGVLGARRAAEAAKSLGAWATIIATPEGKDLADIAGEAGPVGLGELADRLVAIAHEAAAEQAPPNGLRIRPWVSGNRRDTIKYRREVTEVKDDAPKPPTRPSARRRKQSAPASKRAAGVANTVTDRIAALTQGGRHNGIVSTLAWAAAALTDIADSQATATVATAAADAASRLGQDIGKQWTTDKCSKFMRDRGAA